METYVIKIFECHRKKHYFIFLIMLMLLVSLALPAYAKDYFILLSNEKNAPSPEIVFAQSKLNLKSTSWALNSFNAFPPISVKYLIENRPKGDLLKRITDYPDSRFAKMYRYLLLSYSDEIDDEKIVMALVNDSHIENAALIQSNNFLPSDYLEEIKIKTNEGTSNKTFNSDFLVDLNIISAWELSEGMGYIGALDIGLQRNHESLRAFNSNNYESGNLLDNSNISGQSYQEDIGQGDLNIDTKEAVSISVDSQMPFCDDDNDGKVIPPRAGHGTHIAGILAGKSIPNKFTGGVCKNCGLSMMKFTTLKCSYSIGAQAYVAYYDSPTDRIANSIKQLVDIGMGTINFSGGIWDLPSGVSIPANECQKLNSPYEMICDAVALASERNVLLVASAGNDKDTLNLPALIAGTIAAGGYDELGYFWNDSWGTGGPTDFVNTNNMSCQFDPGQPVECGSDIGFGTAGQNLDVMTQAKDVVSTFYTGEEWASYANCSDSSYGTSNDGYGKCTGTSMSAPQVAGIVQLIRSAHPLLPNGSYDPTQNTGIINVLNATASQSTSGFGNDLYYGYGLPDARLALEKILGQSNEVQLTTRLTPMFDLYSDFNGEENNIYTPFSQVAMSFMYRENSYIPNKSASAVSEFQEFWYDTSTDSFPDPTASFYVFTTNNNPFTDVKDMVPLRRMGKSINGNRNDTYAVNDIEIQNYHNAGYDLAGIEGYILPSCLPLPSCIPEGAIALYRDSSNSNNHKLIPASSAPNSSSVLLGYVYLNTHSDTDGLIDGQEIILGTDIYDVDTDGDGISDAEEYPPAGVPVSDPLVNPNGLKWLPAVVGLALG